MYFGAVDWPDKAQFGGACFELLHGEVWGKKKQREVHGRRTHLAACGMYMELALARPE